MGELNRPDGVADLVDPGLEACIVRVSMDEDEVIQLRIILLQGAQLRLNGSLQVEAGTD